jgi:hypothetical protein
MGYEGERYEEFRKNRKHDIAQLVERQALSPKVLGSTCGVVTKSYIAG